MQHIFYTTQLSTLSIGAKTLTITIPTNGIPAFDHANVVVALELYVFAINSYYEEQQQLFSTLILTQDLDKKNHVQPQSHEFVLVSSCQNVVFDQTIVSFENKCVNGGLCSTHTGQCECVDDAFTPEDFCATPRCSAIGCDTTGTARCDLPQSNL